MFIENNITIFAFIQALKLVFYKLTKEMKINPIFLIQLSVLLLALLAFSGSRMGKSTELESVLSAEKVPPISIDNSFSELNGMEAFDKIIEQFMQKWLIRGASVSLVKDGRLIYTKGYGYSDVENGVKSQPSHLFRIASVSKLITAVAIMRLVEDGKLSLDTKVFGSEGILNDSTFLNIADKNVYDITVKNLLNHSGGWSLRGGDPMFMPTRIADYMNVQSPPSTDVIIKYILSKCRLAWKPGTRSCYSNFGYAVLGKVIEKVSVMNYETYVRLAVLQPLGIFDMQLAGNFERDRLYNEAKYYVPGDYPWRPCLDGSPIQVPAQYGGNDLKTLGAAGGWLATSIDLSRIMIAIDGDDNASDILMPSSVYTMADTNERVLNPLGWKGINKDMWWRSGSFGGTSALMVKQNNGISWVFVTNTSTWKGAAFPHYIMRTMKTAIDSMNEWPDHDLFVYNHMKKMVEVKSIRFDFEHLKNEFSYLNPESSSICLPLIFSNERKAISKLHSFKLF